MTNQRPSAATDTKGGYVVRVPRVTDAVGRALRGAFDGGAALPDDIAAALAKLDRAVAIGRG